MLAKPLEEEQPQVMIWEQLKTYYHCYLKLLLPTLAKDYLDKDMRDGERDVVDRGFDPHTRREFMNWS